MSSALQRLSSDEKRSHFRNITVLALKDGKVEEAEKAVLQFVAEKWDIDQKDLDDVLASPDSIDLVISRDEEACFHQLYDLTEMMIIDEVISAGEKELCTAMAEQLGYPAAAVDLIVRAILEGNRSLKAEQTIQRELRESLKTLQG